MTGFLDLARWCLTRNFWPGDTLCRSDSEGKGVYCHLVERNQVCVKGAHSAQERPTMHCLAQTDKLIIRGIHLYGYMYQ